MYKHRMNTLMLQLEEVERGARPGTGRPGRLRGRPAGSGPWGPAGGFVRGSVVNSAGITRESILPASVPKVNSIPVR